MDPNTLQARGEGGQVGSGCTRRCFRPSLWSYYHEFITHVPTTFTSQVRLPTTVYSTWREYHYCYCTYSATTLVASMICPICHACTGPWPIDSSPEPSVYAHSIWYGINRKRKMWEKSNIIRDGDCGVRLRGKAIASGQTRRK